MASITHGTTRKLRALAQRAGTQRFERESSRSSDATDQLAALEQRG